MSWLMPWRRLIGLALVVGMLATAAPALAASCHGASHEASLTNGSVSPDGGEAGASFRFKVTYSDNAGCVPARVTVRINGVGAYDMSARGSSVVSYQRDVVLPAGAHRYAFEAESGSGQGYQLVTLTNVSPPTLTVTNPAPKPTPKPDPATPRPAPMTPRPAPATPKPAPATPLPEAAATPLPEAAATTTPSPSLSIAADPTAPPAGTALATRQPVAVWPDGGSVGGGARPAGLGAISPLAEPGSALPWLLAWAVATSGGLTGFIFLVRRGSPLEPSSAQLAGAGMPTAPSAPGSERQQKRRRMQTGDESQLPRWLRPSVQAARYARPGQDGAFSDD